MSNSKQFFSDMLSPFVFKPILDYTFQEIAGSHTSMGSEFLTHLLFNLFISEP
jgi:hypothetical protein